jgi:biotin-(acetyl-CoA carboxylase) ligase
LLSVTGQVFDTSHVADLLISQLNQGYESLLRNDLVALEDSWRWRLGLLGKEVIAEDNDGNIYRGRLRAMDFDGVFLENGGNTIRLIPEMIRRLAPA